jgi:hypothetical protein
MSGLNKAGISLIVAVLIMAGMLTTMGQINNGGGGGGSGTVGTCAAAGNAYYSASGTTITCDTTVTDNGSGTVSMKVLGLNGATSGTSTFTPPAVAGTVTNPVTMTNVLSGPAGTAAAPTFSPAANQGVYSINANALGLSVASGNVLTLLSSGAFSSAGSFTANGNNTTIGFGGNKGQHFITQAAASDTAGTCTAAAATTCTVTFTTAYTSAPSCTVTDQTNIIAFKALPSTTNLVITTTSASSDVFSYICIGNPN